MSDPRRLLQTKGTFESGLLSSALDDAGTRESLDRVLAGLGVATVGSAAAATLTATQAAASAPTTALTSAVLVKSSPAVLPKIGFALALKWSAVGATAGALTLGVAHVATVASVATTRLIDAATPADVARGDARATVRERPGARAPAASVATTDALTAIAPTSNSREAADGRADVAARASDTPLRPSSGAGVRPRGASAGDTTTADRAPALAPPSASPTSTLGAEVLLLDDARAQLSRNDAASALDLLDRHRRAFPRAALEEEATVLRVRALIGKGDRVAAADCARTFLAAHPAGPHATLIRELLGRTGDR